MRFNLVTGCMLSLGIHLGFFFFFPAPEPLSFSFPDTPTDTEVLVLEVPALPILSPPVPSPPAVDETPPPSSASAAVTYDAAKIVPPDLERINGAIGKISAGMSAQLPAPTLQLPVKREAEEVSDLLNPSPRALSAATTAMLEQALMAPGLPTGVDKQTGWGQVRLGKKARPSRVGLPKLKPELLAREVPVSAPMPEPFPAAPTTGIQGPAAKREPLYRPPLPKVHVNVEGEITLKFWVRPDGIVSRVLPEHKGDAALEAAAIRHIEGWRFTPIPSHEPQIEQWGIITVRFLLNQR